MADVKTKTYQLVINGVKENIDAVEALNKQLDNLDSRLKNQSRAINIIGGGSSKSELSEKNKLEQQISKNAEKIALARSEENKALLIQKQTLKEINAEQKALIANDKLSSHSYNLNTMAGMKERLRDIKAAMQTTDIGSDMFKQLTKEAGELNAKLLEVEKSYGQFGRNVGNYSSGVTEGIMNARQQLKQLKIEMENLTVKKDNGIITPEEEERLKNLIPTVKQLESSIKDAGKPMDALMDTMQSFVALAQVEKGFASLFGLEDTKIDETIKNLVALQNAAQGLQTLFKQFDTKEGIGKYLNSANTAIDKFTKKLFGVKTTAKEAATAAKAQATATSQVATASNAATTAEVAQTTATAGLTVGMRVATVAARVLGMALKAIGIGFLLEGVSWVIEGIKSAVTWVKSFFTVSQEELDAVAKSIEVVKKNTEELLSDIDNSYNSQSISKVQALTEEFHLQAKAIEDVIDQLDKLKKRQEGSATSKLEDYGNLDFDTILKWRKEWRKTEGDLTDSKTVGAGQGVMLNFLARVKKATDEVDKAWKDFNNNVEGSGERLKYAQQNVENLYKEMQQDDILRTVRYNLETFFPVEAFRNGAQQIVDVLIWQKQKFADYNGVVTDAEKQLERELMSADDRAKAEAKELLDKRLELFQGNLYLQESAKTAYENAIAKIDEDARKKQLSRVKKSGSEIVTAEETIQTLRLRLLKDTLIKRLNELDKERRETIAKVKGTEQEKLEIEKLYNQLRLDALNDYINSARQQYDSLRKTVEATDKSLDISLVENVLGETRNIKSEKEMTKAIQATILSLTEYKELVASIGGLEEKRLDYATTFNTNLTAFEFGQVDDLHNFLDAWFKELDKETQEKLYTYFDSLEGTVQEKTKAYYKKLTSMFEEQYGKELNLVRNFFLVYEQNLEESIAKRLQNERNYRNVNLEELLAYTKQIYEDEVYLAKLRKEQADQEAADAKDAIEKQYNEQVSALTNTIAQLQALGNKASAQQKQDLQNATEELQKIEDDYQKARAQAEINYQRQLIRNEEEFNNTTKQLKLNALKEISNIASRYYTEQLQNYRDFVTKFNNEMGKQPIMNDWGIINLKETKANYKELSSAIKKSLDSVKEDRERLNKEFRNGLLTPEVYNQTLRELNDLETDLNEKAKSVSDKLKQLGVDFYAGINNWIQQIGQATNSILSSLSEITNNRYDKMIDEQQQYYDKLSDLYDKQKEKTQEYADAVNQIEGDLSNARGDRREQLIDQLNAEMAAQRESLAQEKRIEKEKEEAEHRKADLEYAQAIARKKMDVAQAIINGLMAASMAAVNKWPIPAIPMIALATATSAAQLAAIKSQYIPKPKYGDGGVILGKSHQAGGVPILGGRAEVEGGEFITNKVTTANNTDLLQFINSKRKKIDIADLIDFYSSPKVRSNIQNVRKFADGGQLPLLRNDMTVDNRMLTMMQEYSTRPVWVAVTEIEAAQSKVNYVRAVSGLKS